MRLIQSIRSKLFQLWRYFYPRPGKTIEARATMVCNVRKIIERASAITTNRRKSAGKLTRKKRTARWRRQLGKRAFVARQSRTRWASQLVGKIADFTVSGPDDALLTLRVIAPLCRDDQIGEIVLNHRRIPVDCLGFGIGEWAQHVAVYVKPIKGMPRVALAHLEMVYKPGLFPAGPPTSVRFNIRRKRAVRWGARQ